MDQEVLHYDVAVIGGGIAGIAAARALHTQSSLNWCIVEASTRLGGRISSVLVDGCRVDTGAYELASFLQKRVKQNALYELIKKGFCQLNFRESMDKVYYYEDNGHQYSQQSIQKITKILEELNQHVKQLIKTQQNISVQQCIDKFEQQGKLSHLNQSQLKLYKLFILMQEHEQGADGNDLAADSFFADDQMEEDQLDSYPLPAITYQGLVHKLVKELPENRIRFGSYVQKIEIKDNVCEIFFRDAKGILGKIIAKYVVCAVPLSVIKDKLITFVPEIPVSHSFIFENLGFGYMEKVILAFEKQFWPADAQRIKIASNSKGKYPHFSNLSGPKLNSQENTYILCCYLTASHAKQLHSTKNNEQIIQQAVQHLQKTFPDKNIKLKDAYVTRWMEKQNIKGAFSYMRPELRFNRAKEIRLPVENKLWFAGEYCYPENIGCAHGAYQTGWEAAKSIISSIKSISDIKANN